jgi:hypothetical protein
MDGEVGVPTTEAREEHVPRWEKRGVGGKACRVITTSDARTISVVPMVTTIWVLSILTLVFFLLFLSLLLADVLLEEVFYVPQRQRDWIAFPGVMSLLAAIGSGWTLGWEVLQRREILQ